MNQPPLPPQGPTGGKLGTQFWQPMRKQTGCASPLHLTPSPRSLTRCALVPPGQGVFARDDVESVLWVVADIVWGGGFCIWKRVRACANFFAIPFHVRPVT